jgi:hypothetical protein
MDAARAKVEDGMRVEAVMNTDDRDYYEGRAEAELMRAQDSEDPAAVRVHYLLAEMHLERASQCPPRVERALRAFERA